MWCVLVCYLVVWYGVVCLGVLTVVWYGVVCFGMFTRGVMTIHN